MQQKGISLAEETVESLTIFSNVQIDETQEKHFTEFYTHMHRINRMLRVLYNTECIVHPQKLLESKHSLPY